MSGDQVADRTRCCLDALYASSLKTSAGGIPFPFCVRDENLKKLFIKLATSIRLSTYNSSKTAQQVFTKFDIGTSSTEIYPSFQIL